MQVEELQWRFLQSQDTLGSPLFTAYEFSIDRVADDLLT